MHYAQQTHEKSKACGQRVKIVVNGNSKEHGYAVSTSTKPNSV